MTWYAHSNYSFGSAFYSLAYDSPWGCDMAKDWVMGSYYRIVQVRKPPTANQLKQAELKREQERNAYEAKRKEK